MFTCSFPFPHNLSILNWRRANKTTLLSLIIPDVFKLPVAKFMYSFYNGGLPNHFDNYFTEIASFYKYQTRHAALQKYYLCPEWKRPWVSFLQNIFVPKFGLIFLKIWNLFRSIHLENNIKMSCYLARIPVDLCFASLSFFVILCCCSNFPPIVYLYSCSPHLCTQARFSPTVFVLLFSFAYFTWRPINSFCYLFYYLWNVFY